jgi:uroporphyrin-III C-methyltransferase
MGKVYLVGAGPGAPDLLTVRAARLLGAADIVFYDALVHPDTLALAAQAEKVAVGKRFGKFSTAQAFINKRLVDAAKKHAVVVRLKGGDPMLFGRAQEEIDALRAAGIAFEVVPGITAALAAAAELGVSLTRRGVARSVAFVTPRVGQNESISEWQECATRADTAVLYMGAREAAGIAQELMRRGRHPSTPVAAVENASLPGTRLWRGTLRSLALLGREEFAGPVLLLIGDVLKEQHLTADAVPLKRAGAG